MTQIRQEYRDEQIRRWMRPDWRNWWKPGSENDPLYKEYERIERKYRPDQLRVERGNEGAGQWAYEGRNAGGDAKPATQIRVAARISPARAEECELQLLRDKFICNTVRLRSCHAQAAERYAACLGGRPIPPLFF